MPTLKEINEGKLQEMTEKHVHLLWDEDNHPKLVEIIDEVQLIEPLSFKASDDALKYILTEINALEEDLKANPKDKALKKKLSWRLRVMQNHVVNLPQSVFDKYAKYANWTVLSTNYDFNKNPNFINDFKDEIILSILQQNQSWINAAPGTPLGDVKTYWTMLIDNHPQKELPEFQSAMLSIIEAGTEIKAL